MNKSPATSKLLQMVASQARHLPVAERRDFLKRGLTIGGAGTMLAATGAAQAADSSNLPPNVPSWQKKLGRGVVERPYGIPSAHEKHVIRRTVPWLTVDATSSISFTPLHELRGIITPNGLVFERYHGGVPDINPDDYRLMIHGLVENPLILTLDDLMRLPSESRISFIECPANGGMEWRGAQMEAVQFTHGMVSCCEWTGVKLSTLLGEVGLKPDASWILAEGSDAAAMTRSIPIEKALDDAMIVYAQNGERLRPEQGYPVRLLNPGWEGNTSVKWLRRLKVGDMPWHHREETSKYTDLMADGRARRFTWVMDANSVITYPCPEKPLLTRGKHAIGGLAWSGRGRIERVDVSTDGGVNWQTAKITSEVLPKALTRFELELDWQGEPLLLQSRAMDETGYVQPTLTQLREVRGVQSIYHKNSIQTWQVDANGGVANVQIS